MKKIPVIFFMFLLAYSDVKAQKEVLFKLKMLPNKNYSSVIKMDMNMEMNMVGDSAFLDQVKKSGQTFPMLMTMQLGYNSNVKTKATNSQRGVPFVMNIQSLPSKMIINGKENDTAIPATNQTFYGAYTSEMKTKIDSIPGKIMDENVKASVIKMLEGIQANIKFPEKPLKIGDTFLQDVPMEIPLGGMSAKIVCKTTYKLISIENNRANFDLKYVMQMDASGQNMSLDMSGSGDGKFIYDMINSYPVNMVNNMSMTYAMVMPQSDKVKMNGKAKMVMINQTTIAAAK